MNTKATTTRRMRLTHNNVTRVLEKCLYTPPTIGNSESYTEPEKNLITVEGISNMFTFDADTLATEKQHIEELLANLPKTFKEGCSFWEMRNTHTGRQWARNPKMMENLLALGLAVNKISYPVPKHLWWSLPGGMPYVVIAN